MGFVECLIGATNDYDLNDPHTAGGLKLPSPLARRRPKRDKKEMNMAYRLSPRLFIENGPANQAAQALQSRSSRNTMLSWRALDAHRRLALVESALTAANEGNSLPVAL